MNFVVKQLDPIEEALSTFAEFNQTPQGEREYTEDQLIQLVVHRVKQHDQTTSFA